jgi:hypothetical protein
MKDSLILIGYGTALVMGIAAACTVVYYGFSRNTRYQKSIRPNKQTLSVENESIQETDETSSENPLTTP